LQSYLDRIAVDGTLSTSTVSAYRRDLESYLNFCEAAGVRTADRVAPDTASSYLRNLHESGRSAATIARNLCSLRRFHDRLLNAGTCPLDPTIGLKQPHVTRQKPDPLTVDEAQRLVDTVEGQDPLTMRDRAILEILYAAGLRVSELIALNSADLPLEHALLRVHGRGARERMVPLGRAAVAAATRYARFGRPSLLQTGDGEDVPFFSNAKGRPLTRMGVWKILRSAAVAAGIDRPVNPQTLRHTFAAHLLDGGFDLRDVQHLLGHANISTTSIYTRADDQRLKTLHKTFHPRA